MVSCTVSIVSRRIFLWKGLGTSSLGTWDHQSTEALRARIRERRRFGTYVSRAITSDFEHTWVAARSKHVTSISCSAYVGILTYWRLGREYWRGVSRVSILFPTSASRDEVSLNKTGTKQCPLSKMSPWKISPGTFFWPHFIIVLKKSDPKHRQ